MRESLVAALAGGVSMLAMGHAPAAFAADSAGAATTEIGEVVVTAERRTDSILQVPIAISALSGDDLAAQHIEALSDLSARLPNVEINSPRGSSLTDISIRGVGIANDFSPNQSSPVGVYLDDSYMASRNFSGAQAYDLDRVEVLRGPQGTLFGRNTTGGLVNFITRGPRLGDDRGRIELGYGAYNDVRVQGAYEHTFAPDVFGVRIAGNLETHDGYYHNLNAGQADPDDLNTRAGRIEARWKPTGSLDIVFKAYGQHDDNKQWASRIKLVGGDAELPASNPFDVTLTTGGYKTTSAGTQLKIVGELTRGWTLTNLVSADRGTLKLDNVDLGARAGANTFGFTTQSQQTRFRQANEELRLNYDGGGLKAVAGLYYGRDSVDDNERYNLFTVFPVSPIFRYQQTRVAEAAFAQADWAIRSNLTLTGGLRFTHDDNVYAHGHADVSVPVVPGGLLNTLPGAGTPACPGLVCPTAEMPTLKGSYDAVTGRLAAKYTLSDGHILFASYSRGYRSGSYNGVAYLSPVQVALVRPERVDSFEVGAKGKFFDGRAQASASLFYNDYRDQQVNIFKSLVTALGPFPVNLLENVPKATTMGLEFDGEFVVAEPLRLRASLALLDAHYGDRQVVADVDVSNNRLPYSARVSGSFGFSWTVGQVAGGEVVLAPVVVYSSSYFFDPSNNPNVGTPGFTRVNATLSWVEGAYAVRLWGNNLFNEKYSGYGADLSQNTGNFVYVGAPPRTYGLSVSREF